MAMSGGVDSSVSAALLKDEGYDVTGIMLKLWRGEEITNNSGCCNLGAADDARRVAATLDIPFYVFNMADRFEQTVVRDFTATYAAGRTPNPCVRCNQWIKFDALLERAKGLGAHVLATGHYARVTYDGSRHRLLRGVDRSKDQSYVLWMLTQEQLAHVRFPVGEMSKVETRAIAHGLGLRTAAKADSQEICFVRDGDIGRYIDENVCGASMPGPVMDASGAVVGQHAGAVRYTIGQRRGLGVAVGHPVFVTDVDVASNTVFVGERDDLLVGRIYVEEASFVAVAPAAGSDVVVQYRAHGDVAKASVGAVSDSSFDLSLLTPVEAVAPGQSVALYSATNPDELVAGGVIASTTRVSAAA